MAAVTASATVLKIRPAPIPPGAEGSSDDVGADDGSDVGLRAWRGLLRTHALLAKRVEAQLDREHKLPLSSYEVLQRLLDAPGGRMRMCDLAEQVQLSRSGLSRLADRLEREELLSRCSCDHDARGAYACLTDSGRERLDAARETHRSVVCEHFLSHFSTEELSALAGMWERILPSCCNGE